MTTYYWVGGGSSTNWNATANTNWSLASGGSNNAAVPSTGDTAIFDGNSGSGTVALNVAVSLVSLDFLGFAGTFSHSAAITATITASASAAVALRFSTGMTYTPAALTSIILFNNTTTSNTVNFTSGNQRLAALTCNNTAGGTTQQQDSLSINAVLNSTFTLTAGTWDSYNAGANYAFTAIEFFSSNSNTRKFIQGGLVTLCGNVASNQSIFNTATVTGMTWLNSGGGTITILAPTSSTTIGCNIGVSNLSGLPAITFNPTTSAPCAIALSTSMSVPAFTFGAGWTLQAAQSGVTITAAIVTFNGTQAAPCAMTCIANASQVQLVCSTSFTAVYTAIGYVSVTGAPTVSINNSLQFGPTPGLTFTNSLNASGTLVNVANAMPRGTATSGGSTTSIPTSAFGLSLTNTTQLVGRGILFDIGTITGGLQCAQTVITGHTTGATPTFTVSPALPTTPAAGDLFTLD